MLERPHLHLPYGLLPIQCLIEELVQLVPQQVPQQVGLFMSLTFEGIKSHPSLILIRVLQYGEEGPNLSPERPGAVGDGGLHGSHYCSPHQGRGSLQLGYKNIL